MVAVRYAALAALVLWIGGMVSVLVGDVFARFPAAIACGMVVLVSLFVMKFVGPPPQAFPVRAAIVAVMLAATMLTAAFRVPAAPAAALNAAFGAILLFWYVGE
jgi:hypothetical protein